MTTRAATILEALTRAGVFTRVLEKHGRA